MRVRADQLPVDESGPEPQGQVPFLHAHRAARYPHGARHHRAVQVSQPLHTSATSTCEYLRYSAHRPAGTTGGRTWSRCTTSLYGTRIYQQFVDAGRLAHICSELELKLPEYDDELPRRRRRQRERGGREPSVPRVHVRARAPRARRVQVERCAAHRSASASRRSLRSVLVVLRALSDGDAGHGALHGALHASAVRQQPRGAAAALRLDWRRRLAHRPTRVRAHGLAARERVRSSAHGGRCRARSMPERERTSHLHLPQG